MLSLGLGPLYHRKRLEEAPLVTKAFREAQMKEKLERYPKVSSDFLTFLWGGLAPESDCDIRTSS